MIEIVYAGVHYPAAECSRCGCKIFPPGDIKIHEAIHAVSDLLYAGRRQDLEDYFRKMRNLKWTA